MKKIDEILKKIPNEKSVEASLVADEIKFVAETIDELKKTIKDTGAVEHFINGKQNFLRESPALKSYTQLMKTYDTLYKNLINLLPKDEIANYTTDELMNEDY